MGCAECTRGPVVVHEWGSPRPPWPLQSARELLREGQSRWLGGKCSEASSPLPNPSNLELMRLDAC